MLNMDEACLKFGQNISRARRARNLTQNELARAAGISMRTVQRAEHGDSTVALGSYTRILRVFGLESHISMIASPSLDSEMLKKAGADLPRKIIKGRGSRARAIAEALLPAVPDDLAPDMA